MTTGTDDLFSERERLVDIAQGILPSTTEAERAVDLTFARWLELSSDERASTGSRRERLTEILARICLDLLGYTPAPSHSAAPPPSRPPLEPSEPADRVTLDDSMYMLLLVVLDSLRPEERVAFILHDVFGVAYRGIADVVGRSPDDARELARSARRRIQQQRLRESPPDRHRSVVLALLSAVEEKDAIAVCRLLHDDVIALVDTGGTAEVAPAPVSGAEKVARLLIALSGLTPPVTVSAQSVNGRLGLVARREGRVVGVVSLSVAADAIRDIWIVLAPEKLARWNDS
ncbi:sigma factor-like helix-turn-helix DNA-binding protein [Herbiconiux sp. UC225_62]|uniref:sigma factor-like helix-turn-helix DNA-binding protein n=1 Tax=Herbiconiux sp. UC225_62 TaxID=3350168 RepID=UPI0036D249BF